MAYFECIIDSGGETGISLTVTCTSDFADQTITCTDGTTTLTGTCPHTSPYQIVFYLPNSGTWTVSGYVSGTLFSEDVIVQDFDVELIENIDKSVTVYSAAKDTVSYTGLDGATHTITTNSSGKATATITIAPSGSTFTFKSSVAKNPSSLSSYYTKSITITNSTSTIYVMPTSGSKMLYWYGYDNGIEAMTSANGWTAAQSSDGLHNYSFVSPTFNTNYVALVGGTTDYRQCGIGSSSSKTMSSMYAIVQAVQRNASSRWGLFRASNSKNTRTGSYVASSPWYSDDLGLYYKTVTSSSSSTSCYPHFVLNTGMKTNVYALWIR